MKGSKKRVSYGRALLALFCILPVGLFLAGPPMARGAHTVPVVEWAAHYEGPDVNPGAPEIPGNGISDDCDPSTPSWGTPASIAGDASGKLSTVLAWALLFLIPAALVIVRKAAKGKRKGTRRGTASPSLPSREPRRR